MSDEEVLLEAVVEHDRSLRRIASVYAGEDGEEDDLHQEILTEAWRSLPSFRGASSIGTWLYRVAINTALTWKRRSRKHVVGRVPLENWRESPAASSRSTGAAPGAGMEILADFLGTLTGSNHTVLVLYMEGLTHAEIADVTGLSVSAIAVRIHRMKQAFTERYVQR